MFRTLGDALTDRQRAQGNPPDRIPAGELGVPEATYSRWKSGGMVPRDNRARDLADYLGMDIDDVFALLGRSRLAQEASTQPGPAPVSRAEFDTLKAQFEALMHRLDDVIEPPSTRDPTGTDPDGQPQSQPSQPENGPHQQ